MLPHTFSDANTYLVLLAQVVRLNALFPLVISYFAGSSSFLSLILLIYGVFFCKNAVLNILDICSVSAKLTPIYLYKPFAT